MVINVAENATGIIENIAEIVIFIKIRLILKHNE